MRLDSIQEAWKASLLLGAGVGVILVLRWVWWRMNAIGELSALIADTIEGMRTVATEIGLKGNPG